MNKEKIVVIVQARMGSSRLPNKMMLSLHGFPVIEWVRKRIKKAKAFHKLIFAIPDKALDAPLVHYLEKMGESVFQGSEDDVLERFYRAAKLHNATHVVRVCADNPCICPEEIDNLISFYFSTPCDYCYNNVPRNNNYADGLGAEIVSMEVLEMINEKAKPGPQREHLFNYLWDNKEQFRILTFDPPRAGVAFPQVKLDIDTSKDYLDLLQADIDIDMDSEMIVAKFVGLAGR